MQNIAVMTSGGDAPGMNAAIRAVVRTAIYHNIKVYGIRRGYQGMIEGDFIELHAHYVANILQRGGTILKTARSKEFLTKVGRQKAFDQLQKQGIEGLVLIGGDGTFRGANNFADEFPIKAMGIPGTIDKDIAGTDYTIGFDTAVNTAVEAIDKIRDTAHAHDRIFIVEVMGRDAGYIALNSGVACGAEDILVPETTTDIEDLLTRLQDDKRRKRLVRIIVVAEGDDFGGALDVHKVIAEKFPEWDVRASILGHIQRGGNPTYYDRVQASRMGYHAVLSLMNGRSLEMVGLHKGQIIFTPFSETVKQNTCLDKSVLEMASILSI